MALACLVVNRQLMVAPASLRSASQGVFIRVAAFETGPGPHAELDLRHVQPATMLRRVVGLQTLGYAAGLRGRKVSYNDTIRWVFKLSSTSRTTGTSG